MKRLTFLATATAVALAACSDSPTGVGNATQQDRQEVIDAMEASGWFADAFGVDGTAEDATLSASFTFSFSQAAILDTVPLTQRWGRRYGAPVSRDYAVNVTGDTAQVSAVATFDGVFLLDRTADGMANPTQKPLHEQAVQYATLVRRAQTDTAGRQWQLVALSPREWRMTDEAARTVRITRVVISVNGETTLDVTDPSALLDASTRIPRLHVGDSVSVRASVENTTGIDNVPPTFVFLHVYHAGPTARIWVRIPMRQATDGTFVRHWIVRFTGRERMVVDAIDSQAFNTDSEDDYRANSWGIPYRIQ
jgi:hypothetical protein